VAEPQPVKIGVVGDYREQRETHVATMAALQHAADALGVAWLGTAGLARHGAGDVLVPFDGVFVAPGSPYESTVGALDAIRWAREHDVPVLGTCGGFQHIVLEFARNVAGIDDAAHAETDPDASCLVVHPLTCSLVGQTFPVTLVDGTTAARTYGCTRAVERYYCNFGLNAEYIPALTAAGLVVSGTDAEGEARVVELAYHRWFVGTLFVPQTASTLMAPHPLVRGFVAASATTRVP
jgi:CTP synthase (UTP-ammonia lyase)